MSPLQQRKAEPFFQEFEKALRKNDTAIAKKIAGRIKNTLFFESTTDQGYVVTLPSFHNRIVSILSQTNTPAAATSRAELAEFYFQDIQKLITCLKPSKINWLSNQQLDNQPFYYHATTPSALKNILKTGEIRLSEWPFPGAFVSVGKPDFSYGPVVLALNKSIERLSPVINLIQSFKQPTDQSNPHWKAGWVGFLGKIPVTPETLSHVFTENNSESYRRKLEQNCRKWANREVAVLSGDEASRYMRRAIELNPGIPKEWGNLSYRLPPSQTPQISRSIFLPSKL